MIEIEENVGANRMGQFMRVPEAFIMNNAVVVEGAIVGARAVAVKDVEPWTIVTGNPAKFIKKELKK